MWAAAEFAGASGIADFVVATHFESAARDRVASGVPFVRTVGDADLLALIPLGRHVALDTVAVRRGVAPNQVRRTLARFARQGWVEERAGLYVRNRVLQPIGRLYALEAKVADWRRGLAQAIRYSTWSNAAGVVLLKQPKDLQSAVRSAKSLHLGLGVNGKWLVRPRLHRNSSGARLLASEALVASFGARDPH